LYYKVGDDTKDFSILAKELEAEYDDLLIVTQQGGDGGDKGKPDDVPDAHIEKLKKIMLGK